MKRSYLIVKRLADMVLSGVAILALSPVLIVTAVVLKMTGEHLVIFRQRRVGRDYEPMDIYKFVTMRSRSELAGTITAKNDPRVLPVGKILRKTKINELPQLFNILFGHMSVVGPRPLVESEVAMYPETVRNLVYAANQPGLTGIGSLFFRDEDELIEGTGKPPERAYAEDIMPIKGALEAWYREHKSIRLDLKIILLTAWAVVRPSSAPVVASFRREESLPPETLSAYESLLSRAG